MYMYLYDICMYTHYKYIIYTHIKYMLHILHIYIYYVNV